MILLFVFSKIMLLELSKNLNVVFSNNVSLSKLEGTVRPQIVIVGSIGGQIIVNKDVFVALRNTTPLFEFSIILFLINLFSKEE